MIDKTSFSPKPLKVKHLETEFRKIATEIPCPGSEEIIRSLAQTESRSMQGQLPLVWDKAKDFSVFDICGNKWIDFTSTIFVANVGHSNTQVLKAIESCLDSSLISCYAYPNRLRSEYLRILCEFCGGGDKKAFLLSAGTEATEAALKLMRMAGHAKDNSKKKNKVICIENNWHGRTLGAQMLSSNSKQKEWIRDCDSDIIYIPFPYPWEVSEESASSFVCESLSRLEEKGIDLAKDVCGFMLETFQGWGAVFYPQSYVEQIQDICRENDILLCFDEMQSGFARTGKKFGYMHYNVDPDLICLGKGMGGGISVSGVVGRSWIMDLPEVGNMSSTHSANPLACAAGKAVIEEIESRDLVASSLDKGRLMHSLLGELVSKHEGTIERVLGKGLIAAIFFKDSHTAKACELASSFALECMRRGVLVVHTGRETVKLGPPLTIPKAAIEEAVEVMDAVLSDIGS